jgi:hypothetical protein
MARMTDAILRKKIDILNRVYGYKTPPEYKRLKSGKYKAVGKGFDFAGSYGRVEVVYINHKKGSGQSSITYLMTKPQLGECIDAMIKGYQSKKY